MTRILAAAVACLALAGCNTFYAEAEQPSICLTLVPRSFFVPAIPPGTTDPVPFSSSVDVALGDVIPSVLLDGQSREHILRFQGLSLTLARPGRALLVPRREVRAQRAAEVPEGLVQGDRRVVGGVEGPAGNRALVRAGPAGLSGGGTGREEPGAADAHLSGRLGELCLRLGELRVLPGELQRLVEGEGRPRRGEGRDAVQRPRDGGDRGLRDGGRGRGAGRWRGGLGLGGAERGCDEQCVHSNLRAVRGSSRDALWAG